MNNAHKEQENGPVEVGASGHSGAPGHVGERSEEPPVSAKRWRLWSVVALMALLGSGGLCLPEGFAVPVQGARPRDFHPASFWYYPWGRSGVHKGVDIFAAQGTEVRSSTTGLVLYAGEISLGGKVLLLLGPKWRLHYYAHLARFDVSAGEWVSSGTAIGAVGTSGNAAGKAPHLHYAIATLVPYPWRVVGRPQGWLKMFYLDPTPKLRSAMGK